MRSESGMGAIIFADSWPFIVTSLAKLALPEILRLPSVSITKRSPMIERFA